MKYKIVNLKEYLKVKCKSLKCWNKLYVYICSLEYNKIVLNGLF